LAAVTVATTLLALGFGASLRADNADRRERRSAQDVCRAFLAALTNFDGRTIDADFDRIGSYGTGDFAKQATTFFGSDVRKAMQEVSASSRGQLRYLFLQDFHLGTASVYAVVDQTIINNKFKTPEADELRVEVTLVKVQGAWRVSELTVLQSPPVSSPLTATTVPATPAAPTTTSGLVPGS
jgi:Mce-associated membrane protein